LSKYILKYIHFILQAFEETIRLTAIFWQRNVRQQRNHTPSRY